MYFAGIVQMLATSSTLCDVVSCSENPWPLIRSRYAPTTAPIQTWTWNKTWRAQDFSYWMTTMLHRFPGDDAFQRKLQLAQLRWVSSSPDAAASLAENYVGVVRV